MELPLDNFEATATIGTSTTLCHYLPCAFCRPNNWLSLALTSCSSCGNNVYSHSSPSLVVLRLMIGSAGPLARSLHPPPTDLLLGARAIALLRRLLSRQIPPLSLIAGLEAALAVAFCMVGNVPDGLVSAVVRWLKGR